MFGRKNKLAEKDKASKQLQASGVYSLGHAPHPYIVGDETVEAVKTRKIYNLWSGAWYTAILSVLLFWLPPFGQMIAGYVGGRKAGTPWKGAIAALIPMSLVFLLFLLRFTGMYVSQIDRFLGLPGEGAAFISGAVPIFGPVIGFMSDYASQFAGAMWSMDYFIYPYVLTVIFGYVGGILSLQHRREMEADGKEHPFIQLFLPQAAPAPEPAPEPAQEEPASPPPPKESKANPRKDWKMKKDRKKEKW